MGVIWYSFFLIKKKSPGVAAEGIFYIEHKHKQITLSGSRMDGA